MASKSNSRPEANDSIPRSPLKPEGSSQTNKRATNSKGSDTDIAKLTTLMTTQAMVVDDEQSEKELEELLKQLDEASVLADGIEDRVDALLANLDGMLGGLDAGDDKEGNTHDSSCDPPGNAGQATSSSSGRPNHQVGGRGG